MILGRKLSFLDPLEGFLIGESRFIDGMWIVDSLGFVCCWLLIASFVGVGESALDWELIHFIPKYKNGVEIAMNS